ncbi:hypothetical protein CRG98_040596, partial [Punica granatum]
MRIWRTLRPVDHAYIQGIIGDVVMLTETPRKESERGFRQRRKFGAPGATTIFGESHDHTDHRSCLLSPASTAPTSVDLLFSPTGPATDDLTVIRPLYACPRSTLSTQAPDVENSSAGATEPRFAGSTGRWRTELTPQAILVAACSSLSHISTTLSGRSNSTDIPRAARSAQRTETGLFELHTPTGTGANSRSNPEGSTNPSPGECRGSRTANA